MSTATHTADWEAGDSAPKGVICPICLDQPDWSRAKWIRLDEHGGQEPLYEDPGTPETLRRFNRTRAHVICPSSMGADGEHHLPARYLSFRTEPLVIGVVGQTSTGKSHLLATMINRLNTASVPARFGLDVHPLDLNIHQRYVREQIRPLIERRQELAGTGADQPVELADAFEIRARGAQPQAVAFFDIAGELLAKGTDDVKFMMAVNALLFVVDATLVPGLGSRSGGAGDEAFDTVLTLLHQVRGRRNRRFLDIPAAIVVNKSDTIRARQGHNLLLPYTRAARPSEEELDLSTVERESADVFALLDVNGGDRWLTPMLQFAPTTLHLASATGTDAGPDGYFPEDRFRPQRVLKPLLTLLAYHRLLGPDAYSTIARQRR